MVDTLRFRRFFAVIKAVRNHSQGQRLHSDNRLFSVLAINHNAWQLWDVCQPAAVLFAFDLDCKSHA